ncbi:hypothetical protein FJTKL_10953 [Diaporthe vaccinii]|uniref:Uncharacterized protein n=1 Tax=Diaporthe vaccinii TaxID=105482 RepID=A0ABR4EJ04_9PEZI
MVRQGLIGPHFYLPNEVAWSNLMHLQERYLQGWVTVYTNRHAWESILRVYLPDRNVVSRLQLQLQPGQTPQGAAYSVDAHPSDQGERDHGAGAGATVERIIMDLPACSVYRRDILYVKCSPPSDSDAQSQWSSAMKAAVARLGQRHATRALYFILGVGMEWLPFYWDPHSPAPVGKALRMAAGRGEGEGKGASGWYEVSPEVRRHLALMLGMLTERVSFVRIGPSLRTVSLLRRRGRLARCLGWLFRRTWTFWRSLSGWWRDMLMPGRMTRILSDGGRVQIQVNMPMLLVMQVYNLERSGCAMRVPCRSDNTGRRHIPP